MKKNLWAICYGIALTAFTAYIALDTFVLTDTYQTGTTEMNTAMFEEFSASAVTQETTETAIAETEVPVTEAQSFRSRKPEHSRHSQSDDTEIQDVSEQPEETQQIPENQGTDFNSYDDENISITLTEYYENNSYQQIKNEYSGIYDGKNIIVIHAESLQTIALEKTFEGVEVTPNINKLAKEGLYFSNFYSQVGVGTSSDAEFTFSTSLMPSSSGTVFVNYFDRKYITIQNQFKQKEYYTFSMHGNTGDFWNRATMHENMGYDKFYSKSSFDIDETIGLGLSDKSFFRQVVEKIKKIDEEHTEPFYGTLISLTNHTPFSDLDLMDEYPTTWTLNINGESVTRNYINETTLGNYFRSVHYFDQAIGQFINDMDKEGLLDNTVIVIYGDHDARISKKNYNILYNYDPYTDKIKKESDEDYVDYNDYMYKLDRKVPFIIWSKDKKIKKEVKTATGMIDAFPIIGNMFNVYSVYQLGTDTINAKDNTVVFTDGSYVTNKIYYNGQNGEIYSINGEAVDERYIDEKSEHANKIIEVSNNIITYDLIKEIEKKTSDE